VKKRKVAGFVAVALAYAYACGGTPAPSIPAATTDDAGADDEGGGGGNLVSGADADAGHKKKIAKIRAEGGVGAVHGATNTGPNGSSSQYCCVSGAYYACLNAAALAQCTTQAPPTCTREPSGDPYCVSVDGGSGSSGTSFTTQSTSTPTNACGGYFPPSLPCGTGNTCIGGGHCTRGSCYPNDVLNPCTYPSDCGDGNHCTNGCCASPAKGSACSAFWDCKSNNCTNGICQ
jgi:hypothetical protein